MKRIGVFLDISNLYYCISKKYENDRVKPKIDFLKYMTFLSALGEVKHAFAYGAQMNRAASDFIVRLQKLGFTTRYKRPKVYNIEKGGIRRKADWDVGITVDIVEYINDLDIIVLGSADGDFTPLVEWIRSKGVDIIIVACRISRDLKDSATKWIEIPESFLEDRKEEVKR